MREVAESQGGRGSLYREYAYLDYEDRKRELTPAESARLAYLDAIIFPDSEWYEEDEDDAEG